MSPGAPVGLQHGPEIHGPATGRMGPVHIRFRCPHAQPPSKARNAAIAMGQPQVQVPLCGLPALPGKAARGSRRRRADRGQTAEVIVFGQKLGRPVGLQHHSGFTRRRRVPTFVRIKNIQAVVPQPVADGTDRAGLEPVTAVQNDEIFALACLHQAGQSRAAIAVGGQGRDPFADRFRNRDGIPNQRIDDDRRAPCAAHLLCEAV